MKCHVFRWKVEKLYATLRELVMSLGESPFRQKLANDSPWLFRFLNGQDFPKNMKITSNMNAMRLTTTDPEAGILSYMGKGTEGNQKS